MNLQSFNDLLNLKIWLAEQGYDQPEHIQNKVDDVIDSISELIKEMESKKSVCCMCTDEENPCNRDCYYNVGSKCKYWDWKKNDIWETECNPESCENCKSDGSEETGDVIEIEINIPDEDVPDFMKLYRINDLCREED